MLRGLLFLSAMLGLAPSTAEACLCPGAALAAPHDSEGRVPVDTRHLYVGPTVEGSYRLVGPESSVPLAVEVLGTPSRSFVRLVVPTVLEPETTYEVWVMGEALADKRLIWFVTDAAGDREAPAPPVFSEVALAVIEPVPGSSCGSTTNVAGELVSSPDTRWLHLRILGGAEIVERVLPHSEPVPATRWYLSWLRSGGCGLDVTFTAGETYTIEARAVDLAGNESEPATVEVLVTEPPADGGCVSAQPTGWLALGLVLLGLRRRAPRRTTSARARSRRTTRRASFRTHRSRS
ncbi:MAG: hypothetical protein SFX73_40015 [Kofleriaceae bacterium]|nr:hypothetical protein [Kofleriaceae bacterium]